MKIVKGKEYAALLKYYFTIFKIEKISCKITSDKNGSNKVITKNPRPNIYFFIKLGVFLSKNMWIRTALLSYVLFSTFPLRETF